MFELTDDPCNNSKCPEEEENEDCFYGNGFLYQGKSNEPVFETIENQPSKFHLWRKRQKTKFIVAADPTRRAWGNCWKICKDTFNIQSERCQFCDENGQEGFCCALIGSSCQSLPFKIELDSAIR